MGVITDPIADMLTRIRNANTANHETVDVPASKMKEDVAVILKEEGFIRSYERVVEGPQGFLRITLKYGPEKEKVITGLRRISRRFAVGKPSVRPNSRPWTTRPDIR